MTLTHSFANLRASSVAVSVDVQMPFPFFGFDSFSVKFSLLLPSISDDIEASFFPLLFSLQSLSSSWVTGRVFPVSDSYSSFTLYIVLSFHRSSSSSMSLLVLVWSVSVSVMQSCSWFHIKLFGKERNILGVIALCVLDFEFDLLLLWDWQWWQAWQVTITSKERDKGGIKYIWRKTRAIRHSFYRVYRECSPVLLLSSVYYKGSLYPSLLYRLVMI